ncbi:MAG: hypothetical protein KatS3mg076_0328 [Candidatus Binatia bacterium]|nr:MAG: hypothetical protein KatS3mg076_0328 [Candidatus Binatia bacterium]
MLFYLAKLIQAVGCADVGYALFLGLSDPERLGLEYRLAFLGVAIFYAGRLLERRVSA